MVLEKPPMTMAYALRKLDLFPTEMKAAGWHAVVEAWHSDIIKSNEALFCRRRRKAKEKTTLGECRDVRENIEKLGRF